MRLILSLIALLILIPEADAKRWRWPWEVKHISHRQQHKALQDKEAPVNCAQVMEAVRALDEAHYKEAIKHSTKTQIRRIEKCRTEAP